MTSLKGTETVADHGKSKKMMLSSFLYGVRDICLEQCPTPQPGPGEVLLRIKSVGICGSDVHYYVDGRIGNQIIDDPITMGHEFSAQIAELGKGVKGLETGQLVAVEPAINCGECEYCTQGHPNLCLNLLFCGSPSLNGGFAEYLVLPAKNCFPLPPELDADDGAMLEPLGIAIHAVNLAHLKPGDTVAVLGAGPIGLLTAAVAKTAGASIIYMTEPLSYRKEFALSYIADEVLDPNKLDVKTEMNHLTKGRGVDVVFEAAGAPDTPQDAVNLVRRGGKVIMIGIPSDDSYAFKASTVRQKGLTIKLVRRMKHTYPRAIELVKTGLVDVRSLVSHKMSLEELAQGMDLVADYQDNVIKAIIRVG